MTEIQKLSGANSNKSSNKNSQKKPNKSLNLQEFRKNRLTVLGILLIVLLSLIALLAPFISPHDPLKQNFDRGREAPSFEYPFGTDELGRCLFSRVIYGTRASLGIGVLVVAITSLAGTFLGLVSGYRGGLIDEIIMRGVDIFLSFPNIILALVIAGLLGSGFSSTVFALSLTQWPVYTRLVRGQVLSLKKRAFVEAAKALRASDFYIMRRHILPNCIGPVIVLGTLEVAHVIIFAAALSFLGLGIQPPTPEWGSILKSGIPYLRTAPYITFFPGIMIMLTVLAFNFAGDGLRDFLDPETGQEGVIQ